MLRQGNAIGSPGTLSSQEWRPVVLEILEHGRGIEVLRFNFLQSTLGNNFARAFGSQIGKPLAFIFLCCIGKQLDDGSPKVPHELHLACIVPNVGSNSTAEINDWRDLLKSLVLISYEVKNEARYSYGRLLRVERKRLCVTETKLRTWLLNLCSGQVKETLGRLNADYPVWCRFVENRAGERTRAAPDVGPA
ncbi:MAG: hypothetical protein ACI9W2_000589 [Gammaproteobacteria bacterium]